MALSTAVSLQYDREKQASIAYDLAENFRSTTRHAEAAILLFDYCNDVDEGLTALIEGSEWGEAVRRVSGRVVVREYLRMTVSRDRKVKFWGFMVDAHDLCTCHYDISFCRDDRSVVVKTSWDLVDMSLRQFECHDHSLMTS